MSNPWNKINLSDYENHMKLESVKQLQTLNKLMQIQFNNYPVKTAMVLGVAGGNGLEHIDTKKLNKVYGVDINENYLESCKSRFGYLKDTLQCLCVDLTDENTQLPCADMLIANLLIEYIGYDCFKKIAQKVKPTYISCAIQLNTDSEFVSQSPYLHSFDGLDSIHQNIEETVLSDAMSSINYSLIDKITNDLPNGKKLILLTYLRSQ